MRLCHVHTVVGLDFVSSWLVKGPQLYKVTQGGACIAKKFLIYNSYIIGCVISVHDIMQSSVAVYVNLAIRRLTG